MLYSCCWLTRVNDVSLRIPWHTKTVSQTYSCYLDLGTVHQVLLLSDLFLGSSWIPEPRVKPGNKCSCAILLWFLQSETIMGNSSTHTRILKDQDWSFYCTKVKAELFTNLKKVWCSTQVFHNRLANLCESNLKHIFNSCSPWKEKRKINKSISSSN